MRAYLESLVRDLGNEFIKIDSQKGTFIERTQTKLNLALKILADLKTEVESKPFKNTEDEISYYKHLKPQICSQALFLQNVLRIESGLPLGNKKRIKKILDSELESLHKFHQTHKSKFEYLLLNQSHLDQTFFSHKSINRNWVSSIKAAQLLNCYLNDKLWALKNNNSQQLSLPLPDFSQLSKSAGKLKWTGTKAEIVELIYALQASGTINDGKATIKSIAEFCEQHFDINLEDYRFAFKSIKNRHRSAKFLTKLQNTIERLIDDSLE